MPCFLCDLSDLFDRLNRSDLIVCKHHRNQDRIRADRFFQLVDLYLAVLIDIDIGNLIAPLLEIFARMQDRMVLDLCRDDMLSLAIHKPLPSPLTPSYPTQNRLR